MSDFRYDPNQPPNAIDAEIPSYLKWIYGGVGAVLLGGLLAFAFTNEGRHQTTSNERPGVNAPAQTTVSGARTPAETTGSGAMNRPALPDRTNTRP